MGSVEVRVAGDETGRARGKGVSKSERGVVKKMKLLSVVSMREKRERETQTQT